jgi:nitrogen fixation/metabolism regulation signal transduction histidine kinase
VKTLGTRPKYAFINVRGLVFIYLVLCVITIPLSKTFFTEILREGVVPSPLRLIIFFTIPGVLLLLTSFSLFGLIRDIAGRRTGSKFQARLMAYFIVTVIFAAAPVTIITIQSLYELVHFWRDIDMNEALDIAQAMALNNYGFRTERLERLALEEGDPEQLLRRDEYLLGIQDFRIRSAARGEGSGGSPADWIEGAYWGKTEIRQSLPPDPRQGFVSRHLPRDEDLIRYIVLPRPGELRLFSYSLGEGFDRALKVVANEQNDLEIVESLRKNMRTLLILYYGVFFFPILMMTVIITFSFSRKVTQPIVELTEATRRVAEGDFSIQIMSRPGDELGLLIRSFNAMVQDLEKSRTALVKAEKISIWQSMAQQLAHEIKNPLTPIRLSAERLLRRWRNNPENIGEILESSMLAIIQETEGLSNMLTEFRTLSRPMDISPANTSLQELIGETAAPYRSSFPELRFNLDDVEDLSFRMDRRHISQALVNLIGNAIDAMNGKGTIEIRTDLVKKREIRYCRLSIRDTGKGIPETVRNEIFTPYFPTKESGTGLGLSIVERIVNEHGGTIWFNSAEGTGTTFFIDLPMEGPFDQHTDH